MELLSLTWTGRFKKTDLAVGERRQVPGEAEQGLLVRRDEARGARAEHGQVPNAKLVRWRGASARGFPVRLSARQCGTDHDFLFVICNVS